MICIIIFSMKIYVVNTDESWMKYHLDNYPKNYPFPVVDFHTVWNHGNFDVWSRFKDIDEPIYVLFKTKSRSNHNPLRSLNEQTIYFFGELIYVDEPQREGRPIHTRQTLWNKYRDCNGCSSSIDLKQNLKHILKSNFRYGCRFVSNLIVGNLHFFKKPIDVKNVWMRNFKHDVKGQWFDLYTSSSNGTQISDDTEIDESDIDTETKVGEWLYLQIKEYIKTDFDKDKLKNEIINVELDYTCYNKDDEIDDVVEYVEKPRKPYKNHVERPQNFYENYLKWKNKEISMEELSMILGIRKGYFYNHYKKWVKEIESEGV